MNLTCQGKIDMQTLEDRHKALEKAWDDLLKEKREVEARVHHLEQREMQFELKWEVLIQETQRLAVEQKQFERRKKFFDYVQASYEPAPVDTVNNVINCEGFFSGVSDAKSLKKRYKDLLKIFHPDAEGGDNATVLEINREYDNLKNIIV